MDNQTNICAKLSCLTAIWFKILDCVRDIFLLIIRLYWGYSFFQAGLGKFRNFDRTVGFFQSINIPFPELNVFMAAGTEMLGGICLILGLASRFITVPLIFTMLIAYITADRDALLSIFSKPEDFTSAAPFLYMFVSIIILLFGAGKYSLDKLLERRRLACCSQQK